MPNIININSKKYPVRLKKIKNPPEKLYYLGEWDQEIFKTCLAVVGTRQITDYGRRVIEKIVKPIAEKGVTIVSGFMYGVDGEAHKACLEAGGRTIAVLGAGINLVTPACHKKLKEKILNNQSLLISELEDKHPAFRWTFVKRNRIISGLSQATLVIEAGEKSGSLITAQNAFDQDRTVMAVPGPVTSKVSQGTAKLIKQGAKLVSSYEDILLGLGFSTDDIGDKAKTKKPVLTKEESEIFGLLENEKLTADALSRRLTKPVSEIGRIISMLSLKNLVKQDSQGKYYISD